MFYHSELVIVPTLWFLIGFIFWIAATGWQRRTRLKMVSDFNSKLLDRLGSVKDFHEFIQTEAGAQLMTSMGTEPDAPGPQERILRATQLGIVLLSLGIGLFLVGRYAGLTDPDGRAGFMAIGGITLSLGIGFMISAAASYRIASMLGLLQPRSLRRAELTR